MSTILIYLIIFVTLLLCELGYFKLAKSLNITDKPNRRSSHSNVVIRGGGIILFFGAWLYQIFFGFHYLWMMVGLTALGVVSFVDDIGNVLKKIRLLIQFAAVGLMFINLGLYSAYPLYVVAIFAIVAVGILNAFNFMDGINGITGCYSLSVLIPIYYLNSSMNFIDYHLLIITAIAILIFLIFNFRTHAKCFAGDVGSMCTAFIILFALGKLMVATQDLTYLLFIGVYGADSILTIIHRIKLHEHLGTAHRKHAYQIMSNELHIPQLLVSVGYMLLQLIISFGLILMKSNQWAYFAIVCLFLALAYMIFMIKYYHLHAKYLKST